jgi:hypothetical protein
LPHEFEGLKREAITAASDAYDARTFKITLGMLSEGKKSTEVALSKATASARELMRVCGMLNDPRSTGVGLWLLTLAALLSDWYAEALDYSQQALAVTVTTLD